MVKRSPDDMGRLDDLDQAVIRALHVDGRAPWPRIGQELGCSSSTARRRFESMHSRGDIRIIGRTDVARLGLAIPAMVQFTGPDAAEGDFLRSLRDRLEVRFLATVISAAGSVAEFVVADAAALQGILGDIMGAYNVSAEPFVVTHTYTTAQDWLPDSVERQIDTGDREPLLDCLNEAELTVLGLLLRNGRTSLGELASAIDRSENTARRVMESLRERGLLEFRVLVEPHVLGFRTELMVWLEVEPSQLKAVGEKLARHPATKYLAVTTGRYGLVGQIVLREHSEAYRYATDVLGRLEGLRRVETMFQTVAHKRAWNKVINGRYTREEDPIKLALLDG